MNRKMINYKTSTWKHYKEIYVLNWLRKIFTVVFFLVFKKGSCRLRQYIFKLRGKILIFISGVTVLYVYINIYPPNHYWKQVNFFKEMTPWHSKNKQNKQTKKLLKNPKQQGENHQLFQVPWLKPRGQCHYQSLYWGLPVYSCPWILRNPVSLK